MPEIGQTISHYKIVEKLGAGGMGEVYRAEDTNLNRQVAIKLLPGIFSGDPERLARFEREAKLLASLNHPNIATIHGLETADGKCLLVMELVEGETLAQRIAKGLLPVDEALEVCRQIAEGLEAAHEKGIIHRDLKPANVKITPEGKVKVLDFGLAKAFHDEPSAADLSHSPTLTDQMTRPGVILGTAAYMAPEQAKGKAFDKRADIWAFGCILYECLTRKRPFEGETITETLAAILRGEPDWQSLPETISPAIRRLLRRCMAKDPRQRLSDIRDAQLEIEEARATPAELAGVLSGTHISRRSAMLLSVGALVLGAAIALLAVWYLRPEPPSAAQSPAHLAITLPPGDLLATASYPPLALSPDGSRLVYAGSHGGVQQLFVRSIDSQEAKPLPGTERAESPFFSPDGQWIGFFAGGKLKKVSIAGGTAQTLCDSGSNGGATWGSDDTIIFSASPTSGLLRVSANGGNSRILTNVDRAMGENGHRWPQLLPGGKALLFTVTTGVGWDQHHIAVLRLDTGEKRIVLRGGHTGRFVPTGLLVYCRAGTLLAVPFDPIRLEVTGNAPATIAEGITQSASTIGAEYSFSATGSLAYVPASLRQLERRLVWVNRKGEIELLSAPPRNYESTRLSPDGRQVAICIQSGAAEIWIYDVVRGSLTRLTTEGGDSQVPIWTPDGRRLTYRGYRAGLRNIFWKSADGTGDEERLTTGENTQSPLSWSPDMKWLAFYDECSTTSYDIWTLRLDGEPKQKPFLQTSFIETGARFSPDDGRWLAYHSNESGRYEVYVKQFPGPGGTWQISTEGGTAPCWARNGRELFYRSGSKMMAVDIKTEPTFMAEKPKFLFEGQYAPSYDVSKDGQRFLMIQTVEPEQPATQINLVLSWFEELKRLVPTGKK